MSIFYSQNKNKIRALQADKRIKKKPIRLSLSYRASLSVEASLVIPIFIFAILQLLTMFDAIQAYSEYAVKLAQVGESISVNQHQLFTNDLILGQYLNAKLQIPSANYWGSHVDQEKQSLTLSCTYGVGTLLEQEHHYYLKLWTGYDKESAESIEYVYITETGTVFHREAACSYLRISIFALPYEEALAYSNHRLCQVCETESGQYYVTRSGERFHTELSCSALKRTVFMIEITEIGGKQPCQRCGY